MMAIPILILYLNQIIISHHKEVNPQPEFNAQ